MRIQTVFASILVLSLAFSASPVPAQPKPAIIVASSAGTVRFDIDDLEAMGTTTVRTSTPWTNGTVTFEGVLLSTIVDAAGAQGSTLSVMALNDYSADIPFSDLTEDGPILATQRDGRPMPVTDFGPFFVIYPFDSTPAYRNQIYYGRSVWQVKQLTAY